MTAPAGPWRSRRAVNDTWPRAMCCRSSSRTSPSKRARAAGSLMLGLKNRWLTVRISTVTCAVPTRPVAAPNPVMLRIMWNRVSYGATRTLSIPEVPADAVHHLLSREDESRDVRHARRKDREELLDEQRRIDDAHFNARRDRVAVQRDRARGTDHLRPPRRREERRAPVLVGHGSHEAEVVPWEATQPVGAQVQLDARLILRPVVAWRRPADAGDVDA